MPPRDRAWVVAVIETADMLERVQSHLERQAHGKVD
jgi:hypothetical protein